MDPRLSEFASMYGMSMNAPSNTSSRKLSKKKQIRIKENQALFQKLFIITLVINILFLARFLILNRVLLSYSWMIPTLVLWILQGIALLLLYRYTSPSQIDVQSLKETKGTMAESYYDVIHLGWIIQTLCMVTGRKWPWYILLLIPIGVLWKSWGIIKKGWDMTRQLRQINSQLQAQTKPK